MTHIYLPSNIHKDFFGTVNKTAPKDWTFCKDACPIVVPPGHYPCRGFFMNSTLYLFSKGIEIETGLNRRDFEEEEERQFLECDDGELPHFFHVMLSKETLERLGIEVKTGEGWKWDGENLQSIKVECSEGHKKAWCQATQTWEEHCDCSVCNKIYNPTGKYHVNFDVIKSICKRLPLSLKFKSEVGKPIAVFANRCPVDTTNYCDECDGLIGCRDSSLDCRCVDSDY